jgi:carboxypeptidase Taq
VHEAGHALYEQGRNTAHLGLPVSDALSMGIHESQSLLWERMVGQGQPFWTFITPLVHDTFPQTKYVTAEDFYQWANKVQASLVRVDADELTYPLHIVIRFELEEALMQGTLDVADLPAAWNARYKVRSHHRPLCAARCRGLAPSAL